MKKLIKTTLIVAFVLAGIAFMTLPRCRHEHIQDFISYPSRDYCGALSYRLGCRWGKMCIDCGVVTSFARPGAWDSE